MSSNFVCSLVTAPTEQDRAVARRVLRRIVGAGPRASVRVWIDRLLAGRPELIMSTAGCFAVSADRQHGEQVRVYTRDFEAAVDGARAGREYRARELKRDADAAYALAERNMIDRGIAHALLTKGSK